MRTVHRPTALCGGYGARCLKAVALARGAAEVRSHSLVRIAGALDIDGDLAEKANRLDQYHVSARCLDAYAEGSPYEFFTREQADESLGFARAFLERARSELG